MPPIEFDAVSNRPTLFRPIHYLGSKLRLLSEIENAIERASPTGTVCDLFSGSGTVSAALARRRTVVAVDVQEYARVLSSAILTAPPDTPSVLEHVRVEGRTGALHARLSAALAPLLGLEDQSLEAAEGGSPEMLCDLLEHGTLLSTPRRSTTAPSRSVHVATREAREALANDRSVGSMRSLVTRNFGGVYFSFRQAIAIDALLSAAHELDERHRDIALAPILSATSAIANTIGKTFAQPMRPRAKDGDIKIHLIRQILRDRRADVFAAFETWATKFRDLPRSAFPHRAKADDYLNYLQHCNDQLSVVYADPPYTRDHYSRFYHVLEAMCVRREPTISSSQIRTGGRSLLSHGLYIDKRHQSPFCIKSKVGSAFYALFREVNRLGLPLIISYSPYKSDTAARPRLMSIEDIVGIARKFFSVVEVDAVRGSTHVRLNSSALNFNVTWDSEVIITCSHRPL